MSQNVSFVEYKRVFAQYEREIMATIRAVLAQGDLVLRQQLDDFESNLAHFVGTKHAVGVSNCTDGLHLALRACGIGAGDEVITVSHTFHATVEAIHHAGATPVLVDVGDDNLMDPTRVAEAIVERTRAIIPVHLNGRVCDMEAIGAIAREHNLQIVEDAAQALGARFKARGAGTFGRAAAFSFYPAKLLGAYGDAGAVVTDDPEVAERIRLLRNHGRMPDGDVSGWAFNCRLDNLQAALLDLKLRWLVEWNERRRAVARRYHAQLADVKQLRLPPAPLDDGPHYDVFQNYEVAAERRDELVEHLRAHGVETIITWGGRAVHQFAKLGLGGYKDRLPRTEALFERVLLLPMRPFLTDEEVDSVCTEIHNLYRQS